MSTPPFLAHAGHEGPHVGGLGGWPLIAAIATALVVAIAVYLVVAERRDRRRLNAVKQKHADRLRRRMFLRRAYAGGAALVVIGGGALAAVALDLGATSREGQEGPSLAPPTPGDDFPLEFTEADASGSFSAVVENATDEHAFVQCAVEALDDEGNLVLARDYERLDDEGNRVETDLYTVFFELDAGSRQGFSATVPVTAPVAALEGSCEPTVKPEQAAARG